MASPVSDANSCVELQAQSHLEATRYFLRGSFASAEKLKTRYDALTPAQKRDVSILEKLQNDFEGLLKEVEQADALLFMNDNTEDRDRSKKVHFIIHRTISELEELIAAAQAAVLCPEDFAPLTEQRKENQLKV